ncbi:Amino acid/polyamine/organocation transporter, APC superfamily (fragment) [Frankia canadensis]|uniref:Amino acid/polyamine/organocation transporter, APC superfamily n=1 Tax=Frankia canadensis TaxID=1836972 RepID=A0A2I2KJA6_9ACTN
MPAAGVLAPAAFAAANLIVYWAGWHTDKRLFLAMALGLALFAVHQAHVRRTGTATRDDLAWRTALWIIPWLGGLALISWLGQFDGRQVIPFWADLATVVTFALVIYELAVRSTLSTTHVRELAAMDSPLDLAPAGPSGG